MKRFGLLLLAILLLVTVLPLVVQSNFYLNIIILIFLYAALGSAWDLLAGHCGQFSLGHTFFFGIGAYTSTILFLRFDVSPWVGLLGAAVLAIISVFAIGFPTLKLRGPYFTLATLALAEIAQHVAMFWVSLTNGANGLTIPFEPGVANMIFTSTKSYYYVSLGLLVAILLVNGILIKGRTGYYFRAIKEDQEGAETLGVPVTRYKMLAFGISATLASMVGVIYAQYMLYLDPNTVFNIGISIQIALVAALGGMGYLFGPTIGSVVIIALAESLRAWFPDVHGLSSLLYGIVLIVVFLAMPGGLSEVGRQIMDKYINLPKQRGSYDRPSVEN